jgi:hypothetical protein
MSVSTEVQRTLVKSPPELWTELSNPETLARHLGDFGEIRITKTEPETKIEWEAEQASGVVQLKQSGWGTKVTLSVTRTSAIPEQSPAPEPIIVPDPDPAGLAEYQPASALEPEPIPVEREPLAKPEARPIVVKPEPVTAQPEPEPEPERVTTQLESEPEAIATAEPRPASVSEAEPAPAAEIEPRLGFFARLFRKRKAKPAVVVEPESVAAAEPDVAPASAVTPAPDVEPEPEIEVVALAAPEPIYPNPPVQPRASEPAEDLATELESLEDQIAAETTELLTGVLDRLGAAHHRPFSRG